MHNRGPVGSEEVEKWRKDGVEDEDEVEARIAVGVERIVGGLELLLGIAAVAEIGRAHV